MCIDTLESAYYIKKRRENVQELNYICSMFILSIRLEMKRKVPK